MRHAEEANRCHTLISVTRGNPPLELTRRVSRLGVALVSCLQTLALVASCQTLALVACSQTLVLVACSQTLVLVACFQIFLCVFCMLFRKILSELNSFETWPREPCAFCAFGAA